MTNVYEKYVGPIQICPFYDPKLKFNAKCVYSVTLKFPGFKMYGSRSR